MNRIERSVTTAVLLGALVLVGYGISGRTAPPRFHDFGTVHTRLGPATVFCGGESGGRCGEVTSIRFPSCSPAWRHRFGVASDDAVVRALTERRPPSGDRWIVECG